MADGLKIIVEADVSQATKALQDLSKSSVAAGGVITKNLQAPLTNLQKNVAAFGGGVAKTTPIIGNLADALGGLSPAAKGAGGAVEGLGGNLLSVAAGVVGGHGILFAIEFVGHALIDMAKEFLSSKDSILEAKIAAGLFSDALTQLGKDADKVKAALDFKGDIDKLKFEIAGLSGFKLDKAVFGETIINNQKLADDLDARIALLKTFQSGQKEQLSKIQQSIAQLPESSDAAVKITKQFSDLTKVPKSLLGDLPVQIQGLIETAKNTNEELAKLQKDRLAVDQDTLKESLTIINKRNKEQIRLDKEAASAQEKFITETIARAKLLESELSSLIKTPGLTTEDRVKINAQSIFTALDTKAEQFKKALKLLKDFNADKATGFDRGNRGRDAGIAVPLKTPPVQELKPVAQETIDKLTTLFKAQPIPIKVDFALKAQQQVIADIFGLGGESILTKAQKEAVFAAQAISGVLTPAFQGLFDAILAGENPMKAFFKGLGQAVQQLIQKLIAAAVEALVLSAIFPGGVGGAVGFGKIFGKILGFAQGGIVSGPTLALIGEGVGTSRSNPEIVAPLDQLRAMLGDMGSGGQQQVIITGRLRGRDMILQNARTSRSQRRLG